MGGRRVLYGIGWWSLRQGVAMGREIAQTDRQIAGRMGVPAGAVVMELGVVVVVRVVAVALAAIFQQWVGGEGVGADAALTAAV